MSETINESAVVVSSEYGAQNEAALSSELQRSAGVHALGAISDAEFAARLTGLTTGLSRLDALIRSVMEEGTDVLTLPGVKEKVLSQAGAEKLCLIARLVPQYEVSRSLGKDGEPTVSYLVTCNLHLGNSEGPIVAQAVGAANSFEPKYRYRSASRSCPECGSTGTLLKSKFPAKSGPWAGKSGFYCFDKRGGCGKEFAPDDPAITEQKLGLVDNPDPLELDNTLVKMACKRAMVSAVKSATGGSARFTVDLDEKETSNDYRKVKAEVVSVETEPEEDPEREAALKVIFLKAREKGFDTRAALYRLVAARENLSKVPVKLSDISTAALKRVAEEWSH